MFGGKSYPSCEVTPSLCLPRQFPFFRQRKCQGQGGQQLDWDITHSSWKCQLRKNFTFTLCPLKLLSNQKPFQCLSNVFSSDFFFTAVLSSVNCSSKTFPVLMSGAFYNVPRISRLPARVSLCQPGLCFPVWASSSAVVEAHIGILFAGSSAAARSGRPAWKKCWCVLESGLPSAATTTFLINHTFHLSNPPMTGRTKIRHKARTMIKQMVISNKTSGSG